MEAKIKDLKDNKKGIVIGVVGAIIGILGLFATLYFGFLRDREPRFEYEIRKTDVFNKTESTAYIKAFVGDSINVLEKHYNITTYNIKVVNNGSNPIRYSDYDNCFFGLKVENGTLLDMPLLITASDDYLEKGFYTDSNSKGESRIEIPKLSIDPNGYYLIKVVILHKTDSTPVFLPEGKIIGQKEIEITEAKEPSHSLFEDVFYGNGLVQVVRLLLYFLIGIVLVLIGFGGYITIDNWKDKKKREQNIKGLQLEDSVKKMYIDKGFDFYLMRILDLDLKESEKYFKVKQYIMAGKDNKDPEEYERVERQYKYYNELIRKGFIIEEDDHTIRVNEKIKESVEMIYGRIRGKEKNNSSKIYRSLEEIIGLNK